MSLELTVIGLIIILLLASNTFWAVVCNRLVNKLMSRSYFEFEQAQALRSPSAQPHPIPPETDYDAERQAQEINSIMGVV